MGRMENMEIMQKLQAEDSSVKVMFIHMDLMDRASMEQAVKQVTGVIKHIDVLINGAGVLADKDMETTIGVNLVTTKTLCGVNSTYSHLENLPISRWA